MADDSWQQMNAQADALSTEIGYGDGLKTYRPIPEISTGHLLRSTKPRSGICDLIGNGIITLLTVIKFKPDDVTVNWVGNVKAACGIPNPCRWGSNPHRPAKQPVPEDKCPHMRFHSKLTGARAMTYKTRYTKTYRFVRALNFVWWMMAVVCIYKGGMALTSYNHTPEPLVAVFWCSLAFGLIIAILRGNKKREQSLVKLAQQHRAG